MTTTLTLNGQNVVRVRMVQPWQGVWFADVEIDPLLPTPPIGPAVLTIGLQPLKCFVDSKASGVFGAKTSARVVGGITGGWSRSVLPQHFHNDAVVLSSVVIAATAAEVGEVTAVALPVPLGVDYVRPAGDASKVLDGYDWHVDPVSGTTIVAPRVPAPANPLSVEVLEFDPVAQRAFIATDDVLSPGTVLLDPRFGTATVRDVEQTWDAKGARAVAWCGDGPTGSRLAGALRTLARRAVGLDALRTYKYRVILDGVDGRPFLQPVDGPLAKTPPVLPCPIWFGLPGVQAMLTPATRVVVGFTSGDFSNPVILAFEGGGAALQLSLFAKVMLEIDAPLIGLGANAIWPVMKLDPTGMAAWALEVEAGLAAVGHPVATTFAALIALGKVESTKVFAE